MSFLEDDLNNSFLVEDGCEPAVFSYQLNTVRAIGFFENDPFDDGSIEGFSEVFVIPENRKINRGWDMRIETANYKVVSRRDDGAGLSYVYLSKYA